MIQIDCSLRQRAHHRLQPGVPAREIGADRRIKLTLCHVEHILQQHIGALEHLQRLLVQDVGGAGEPLVGLVMGGAPDNDGTGTQQHQGQQQAADHGEPKNAQGCAPCGMHTAPGPRLQFDRID